MTLSASKRIKISPTTPWTVTISDIDSVFQWEENLCLVCNQGTIQTKIDMINFIKLKKPEYCGWMQVRYLQENSTTWHPASDKMQGTAFYGNNQNNLLAWSIKFIDLNYD